VSLKEYQAKRNFRRTREPSGTARASGRGQQGKFVIQKHAASHLHYDFRLEMGGVLKSWAVPKGFPTVRGERHLAMQVEDHPVEYRRFEGIIPPGNYGAGTVMVWDEGNYSVSGDDPLKALESGKLHLHLSGKKLHGEWTLVRMRTDEDSKRTQWLLLKSGSDLPPLSARAADRSAITGRTLAGIAAANDLQWQSNRSACTVRVGSGRARTLRARPAKADSAHRRLGSLSAVSAEQPNVSGLGSVGESTRRGASPDRVRSADVVAGIKLQSLPPAAPSFLEPMKALLVKELPKGSQWTYEIKFDGVRALVLRSKRALNLRSRTDKDLGGKYPSILQALQALPADQVVLDGEVVAVDSQGRSAFQLLQSYQTATGRKPGLFYYVFDILNLNGRDLTRLPLWQRKQIAEKLVSGLRPHVRFSAGIDADSTRVMREMKKRGLEGLVAKLKDSPYQPGQRTGAWTKFKWTQEQEFVIGGYTEPKGAREHFGAILVGYYQGQRLLFAAKVGTGFDQKSLATLFEQFQPIVRDSCPFANLPEEEGMTTAQMRHCTWLQPKLVGQVRFSEWTRDGHLRQPAFLGLRDDKPPAEVTREIPK